MILAAFRPDTKARLVEEGLVVPTVQMVFRRSLQNVRSRADYFSGAAHPAAFEGFEINPRAWSASPTPSTPTPSRRRCASAWSRRSSAPRASTIFGQGLTEQLFDTPAAIARIWRSKAGRRSMLVSAEDTRDPNGRPLDLPLAAAAGRPGERVRIEPLDGGARARITLDWHDPFRDLRGEAGDAPPGSTSASSPTTARTTAPRRSSAGTVPARRDPQLRARPRRRPAHRRDRPCRPDGGEGLRRPDAGAPRRLARRVRLRPRRRPLGWTRHRAGRAPEDFTAEGARILTRDADGRPDADRAGRLRARAATRAARSSSRRSPPTAAPAPEPGDRMSDPCAPGLGGPPRLQPRRLDPRRASRACCARPGATSS